jgi:hypothetical protein
LHRVNGNAASVDTEQNEEVFHYGEFAIENAAFLDQG